MSRLALYFHTLRYLKPVQIWGRMTHRLRQPAPDLRPAPCVRRSEADWQRPVTRRPAMLAPQRFVFLNEQRDVAGAAAWNAPDVSRLWLYNLHYFDDLNASGAGERRDWHAHLIDRWVDENPAGAGTGWEPYPSSLRIVNWIKWVLGGASLSPPAIHSLAVQARFLARRLEFHLLGNHLLANAKALAFAGLFFAGDEPQDWLRTAVDVLRAQIAEQILADGGHFERSPMYHALVLEDLLDLINAAGHWPGNVPAADVVTWRDAAERMSNWLRAMSHPDGEISFFNDAAIGVAAPLAELESYARRLGIASSLPLGPVLHLAPSGYVRAQMGPAVVFCDVAPVGPDYLPAHGHADTLSFELSLFGSRWIVNSGCSLYEDGAERLRQRGTAAHNTVCIDGKDSSEIWSSFRVGRRARVVEVHVDAGDDGLFVAGAHDGYCRFGRGVIHRRRWRLQPGQMEIEDTLEGRFDAADAFMHLHPEVTVEKSSATSASLRRGRVMARLECDGGDFASESGTWHPEFGVANRATRIRVRFHGARLAVRLRWQQRPEVPVQ